MSINSTALTISYCFMKKDIRGRAYEYEEKSFKEGQIGQKVDALLSEYLM